MTPPETRYAKNGDVHIAYQVFGGGPLDLVVVHGFVGNIELHWDFPDAARFYTRLGSFCRVICFDKRGTGLSDRDCGIATLEERMDDVRAVMDAVGSKRAALVGVSEGGPLNLLFAATHPAPMLLSMNLPLQTRCQRFSLSPSACPDPIGEGERAGLPSEVLLTEEGVRGPFARDGSWPQCASEVGGRCSLCRRGQWRRRNWRN